MSVYQTIKAHCVDPSCRASIFLNGPPNLFTPFKWLNDMGWVVRTGKTAISQAYCPRHK